MASQVKSTSRWGSFLQQAVAGVESRLDTILADEENATTNASKSRGSATQHTREVRTDDSEDSATLRDPTDREAELLRQTSRSRKNDRLQERLAKAVVSRNVSRSSNSPIRSSTNEPSDIPHDNTRSSLEVIGDGDLHQLNPRKSAKGTEPKVSTAADSGGNDSMRAMDLATASVGPLVSHESVRAYQASTDPIRFENVAGPLLPQTSHGSGSHPNELRETTMDSTLSTNGEDQRQLEYIESLQAKVDFLTNELLRNSQSKDEDLDADAQSTRLALKDEKIALLLQEGHKLSQNELRLSNSLKKLRSKSVEDDNSLKRLQLANEKLEATKRSLSTDILRLEGSKTEEQRRLASMEGEFERLRADYSAKTSTLRMFEKQPSESKISDDAAAIGDLQRQLGREREVVVHVKEELSTLQLEQKLALDRHRSKVCELQDLLDFEKERSRTTDLELRAEIRVLEGRLETYRARAEESSTGAGGDTQTKLYRQIETLQSQYNVASENWRGIEGTLLARIVGLEKDRDDLAGKEADLRRRLRETNNKARHLEEDIEQARNINQAHLVQLDHESKKALSLEELLSKSEAAHQEASDQLRSLQEELRMIREHVEKRDVMMHEGGIDPIRAQSPLLGSIKLSADRYGHDRGSSVGRKQFAGTGLGLTGIANAVERPGSRRASAQSPFAATRHDSFASLHQGSSRGSIHSPSREHSVQTELHDDMFDGVVTPATPERTINDMFSASTAAAGPSVQLVERMSAAVRRLEIEKAESNDEMERLLAQRNEAREQVVTLMKETEDRKASSDRVALLEAEILDLQQRYQTTLEMLGEKSERVEELQADISDMKQIYKEVLERTME